MSVLDFFKSPALRVPDLLECAPEIIELPDPDQVVIPLEYPGQILFRPMVQVDDEVVQNQVIGQSEMGNFIHASISGTVTEIKSAWSGRGFHVPAVVITRGTAAALDGDEILRQCSMDPRSATRQELLRAAGVISPWTTPGRDDSEVDIETYPEITQIVIKGINQEPTICSFRTFLRANTSEVKEALQKLSEILPQARIQLTVIQDDATWATETFSDHVEIAPLPNTYRDRIERPAMARLTGINIPNREPQRSYGVAIISIEQLLDMHQALLGQPCIRKAITISTDDGTPPVTVRAPIGTSIGYLLASQGLVAQDGDRIILGGPMTGSAQFSMETPLSKFQAGLHLQRARKVLSDGNQTCINCGRCTQACPINLQIHLIGRFVEFDQIQQAQDYQPEACLECGLCAFVCPAHRPLLQLIKLACQYGSQ